MEKKIIYIDLDGVCADFEKEIIRVSNDKEIISKGGDAIDKVCEENRHIFLNLEPIPGAIETVLELMEKFEVYFLSTPMYKVPESYTDKRLWLEKHFGNKAKKRLILTHNKSLLLGNYLIDDRKANGSEKFKGHHLWFGVEHNWEDIRDFFLRIG